MVNSSSASISTWSEKGIQMLLSIPGINEQNLMLLVTLCLRFKAVAAHKQCWSMDLMLSGSQTTVTCLENQGKSSNPGAEGAALRYRVSLVLPN